MSSNLDGNKAEWFRDLLKWETEGERTPAQCYDGEQTNIDWSEFGELSVLLKPQAA